MCNLKDEIELIVNHILYETVDSIFIRDLFNVLDRNFLIKKILDDLLAFSRKDPASKGEPKNILYGYTSYKAILYYRIAHAIFLLTDFEDFTFQEKKYQYALMLSAKGKILSGAEINPFAKIGARFILDHGIGTVIGETAEIGDDNYILGGVILGARGISNNPKEVRHPKLGNNVQIGSFARLFGPINIGDNVFIGSNCMITEDIPANHTVLLKSENKL
ncbi:serine O-acetyltransferase [Actinobacillus capsulatus]|uniref:serine O-acetyltransferase n=1 Tax=Actinobacillus capsulatus TaxID=717 RepID=UPI0003762409|nr:serine O-acetyltransferase [Actinobacillus capsulatus]